ncbi:MAG: hypothetical protein QF383_05690, partial [Flavobacteriales bacterium]|nr:hypothetical protein [Flavobacteriales bacterium]
KMTKNLLFASAILLITSCTTNPKTEEVVVVETLVANSLTLEFASKNPEVKKEGTHVSASEMLHLSLTDNSQSDFVGKSLTLNNTIEGAINFSSRNDSIFCNAPTSLMLMSMPPKAGVRPATIAANAEFYVIPMSLLKFESVNIMFVGLGE